MKCSVCGEPGHNATRHKTPSTSPRDLFLPITNAHREKREAEERIRKLADGKERWSGPGGFTRYIEDYWKWIKNNAPPHLTWMMQDICDFVENGPDQQVILTPRGYGKSTLLQGLCTYAWKMDCGEKIVVVSKSGEFARQWTTRLLRRIRNVDDLRHLMPSRDQARRGISFDVAGSEPGSEASLTAKGIEEQVEGTRASKLLLDDIETRMNCRTEEARDKLLELVLDMGNLRLLGKRFQCIAIGTLQHTDSVYYRLADYGFAVRKWPIAYPTKKYFESVSRFMAPKLLERLQADPKLAVSSDDRVGQPTDAERMDQPEIVARLRKGFSNFMRNSMMTPLDGEGRCPLKCRNIVVLNQAIDPLSAPMSIEHPKGPEQIISDLHCPGLEGDMWYHGKVIGDLRAPMSRVVMTLDPSSTERTDDFAVCVMGVLNYRAFLLHIGTLPALSEEALEQLAMLCVRLRVSTIFEEANYARGMFRRMFSPILTRVCSTYNWGCSFDSKGYVRGSRETKQELIVEALEWLINLHRLVVPRSVIEADAAYKRVGVERGAAGYRLFHQLPRINPDFPDALDHDDRLDALAMAAIALRRDLEGDSVKGATRALEAIQRASSAVPRGVTIGAPERAKPTRWGSWALRRDTVPYRGSR